MNNRTFIDYVFFVEAWCLLHLAKLVILIVPFKKIASRMGSLQLESTHDLQSMEKITQIEHAVRRASRYTLHNSKFYDKALSAKALLFQFGLPATIYFGLAKESENKLSAHAWVRCGNRIVTGKVGMERFTVIACFGDA